MKYHLVEKIVLLTQIFSYKTIFYCPMILTKQILMYIYIKISLPCFILCFYFEKRKQYHTNRKTGKFQWKSWKSQGTWFSDVGGNFAWVGQIGSINGLEWP